MIMFNKIMETKNKLMLEQTSFNELKKMAKDMNLPKRRSKKEYINDIEKAFTEYKQYKTNKLDKYKRIRQLGKKGKEGA